MSLACGAMLVRLEEIRKEIGEQQDAKLVELWDYKGDYRNASIGVIVEKLKEELEELNEALKYTGPTDILEEIVDVRNVTEFLWDVLQLSRFCAGERTHND